MDKHLHPWNYLHTFRSGQPRKLGLWRGVYHIQQILGVDLLFCERRLLGIPHSHRCGIDDDVEAELLEVGAPNEAGMRLPSEFLGSCRGTVQDVNFHPPFLETKNRSSSR